MIKSKIQKCFDKAILTYDENSIVQQIVGTILIDKVKKYIDKSGNILDIGCGSGLTTLNLLNAIKLINKLNLNDISYSSLLEASNKLKNFNPILLNKCFLDLNFINEIDLVFSNMTLHWVNDFELSLKKIHSYIKTNGLFVFTIPINGNFKELGKERIISLKYYNEIKNLILSNGFQILESNVFKNKLEFLSLYDSLLHIKNTGSNYYSGNNYNSISFIKKNLYSPFNLTYKIGIFICKKV